jgi:uncharacterized small protein (DUF1192 family)
MAALGAPIVHRAAARSPSFERKLAAEFGVSGPAVHYFKVRNAAAITAARREIENELAALWIAQLSARLAELQEDVERINDDLDVTAPDRRPRLYAAKCRALRNAAEELGQLAPRPVSVGPVVRYEIVGVDLDQLR